MKNDRIKENLDACLQEVHVSAALHNEMMHRAMAAEYIRRPMRPRKLIVAVAVILVLLVTTAAALTILELVRNEMQPVREFLIELVGQERGWLLEDKLYYVDLMEKWGCAAVKGRRTNGSCWQDRSSGTALPPTGWPSTAR